MNILSVNAKFIARAVEKFLNCCLVNEKITSLGTTETILETKHSFSLIICFHCIIDSWFAIIGKKVLIKPWSI